MVDTSLGKIVLAIFITSISLVSGDFTTNPSFYGQHYASVPGARGLLIDEANDILVVSWTSSAIFSLYEIENEESNTVDVVKTLIVNASALILTHGIAYKEGWLYASSSSSVYRWPYSPGQRCEVTAEPEVVVTGMPLDIQGHITRTLVFSPEGDLFVNLGSQLNVDPNPNRSLIRKFNLSNSLPIKFSEGQTVATGVRNEVGLAFDLSGVLWGVENGPDSVNRPDLGESIEQENPAEELNRFDNPTGSSYGYPYCFSSYAIQDYAIGSQFAWQDFLNDGIHNDDWCKDVQNNQVPILAMPGHSAPLGIEFYKGESCNKTDGAFPCSAIGDAFIAFHGAWDTNISSGYKVSWLPFDKDTQEPTGEYIDVIYEAPQPPPKCLDCFRPVNAVFNRKGHLIVSDDATGGNEFRTGDIYRVTYGIPPPPIRIVE